MRVVTLCGLAMAMVTVLGCGGDDDGSGDGDDGIVASNRDGGQNTRGCVDEDDDGFGRSCSSAGLDCDDSDPEITDECYRCREPAEDCPCEPGTMMMHCIPDARRVTRDGVSGIETCTEGARYCRDGAWTECEFLAQYTTFTPD